MSETLEGIWLAGQMPTLRAGKFCNRNPADFTSIIEMNAKVPDAFINALDAYESRGWAYVEKGEYDEAIADFTKDIELGDDYAYFARGSAYAEKGEYYKAIADYTTEIEVCQQDPIAYYQRGQAYKSVGKRSGVHRLHAHLCRHTFAINYLLNGGDIFSLREILGHTTLDMVNHYLHFTSSQITSRHHKYSPMDKMQSEGANLS